MSNRLDRILRKKKPWEKTRSYNRQGGRKKEEDPGLTYKGPTETTSKKKRK